MNGFPIRAIRAVCTLAVFGLLHASAAAQALTSRMVSAANSFLSTLNANQRQSVVFAFSEQQQRTRWSDFPISVVPRAGV